MNRNWIVVTVLLGFLCVKNIQAKTIQDHITKCYKVFGPNDDENWDKCSTEVNKLKYAGPNDQQSFIENQCFCDDNCSNYGDCCSDMGNPENVPWMCRPLNRRNNRIDIYMHQKCRHDWVDINVKNLCEYEMSYLFEETGNYHDLQEIPVFAWRSEIMYRNIFCALCNRDDTDLDKWTVEYKCNDTITERELYELVFDPNSKSWISLKNEKNTKCKMVIKEFEDWDNVVNNYKARRCRGISQCAPTWNVTEDRIKCQSSGEIQYIFYDVEDNNTYKNIQCATCNYINITSLTCNPVLSGT